LYRQHTVSVRLGLISVVFSIRVKLLLTGTCSIADITFIFLIKLRAMTHTVSLSLLRPGYDPRLVILEFVVDKVAVGQFFLLVLCFFPVTVIAKVIHIYL